MPRVGHFLAPMTRPLPAQLLCWRQPQSFAQLACTWHHRLSLCSHSAHLYQKSICERQAVTLWYLTLHACPVQSHVACVAPNGYAFGWASICAVEQWMLQEQSSGCYCGHSGQAGPCDCYACNKHKDALHWLKWKKGKVP